MYSDILKKLEICEFCGSIVDPEEINEGLCDRCREKINNDEIIGYRRDE